MNKRKVMVVVTVLVLIAALLSVVPVFAQTKCSKETPCPIEVWVIFADHRYDWAVDAANRFNELYPQYKVTMVQQKNYDEVIKNYVLAKEQNKVPAIAQIYDIGTQFSVDSGYFKFADDIIAGRKDVLGQPVNFDDILDVIRNYYTVNGKWASVAWNTSSTIMYNNMDIMKKVGVTEPPKTWGDLKALCQKLQPMIDSKELDGCATWSIDDWYTEQWMAQQNEFLVNNENGRKERATEVLATGEGMVNITKFYQELYAKKWYVYTGIRKDTEAAQIFGTQKVAVYMTSSAGARGILAVAKDKGVNVVTSPQIYNEGKGYTGNILGGATMWVSNGLDKEVEDGAMAFLLWFSNTENAASWHTASGYVPIRKSAFELLQNLKPGNNLLWNLKEKKREDIPGTNWFQDNPNFATASNQLSNSKVTNATRGALLGTFVETRPILEKAIEEAMLSGNDPLPILQKAKDDADKILKDYNELHS